jgi:3-deoxy-7-phosphoheptulonate synthase
MHLPSPVELKARYPLTRQNSFRQTAIDLLTGKESRLCLIVGPCSIHDPIQGLEYAKKLKALADDLAPFAFLVMRTYIEKPRTLGGWKGLAYDPHLDGSHDLEEGLCRARQFLCAVAEVGMPIAAELLSPIVSAYIDDLVTWGFIGARTAASPIHRELASSFSFPIGFKNSLDGNIDVAINGVRSARKPHCFFQINEEGRAAAVQTAGNPYGHVVHRGSISGPNYDATAIQETAQKLEKAELPARVLIDCAHGNSQKDPQKQKTVFYDVLQQIEAGSPHILGMMVESGDGASLTDPCLSWEETEELLSSLTSMSSVQS